MELKLKRTVFKSDKTMGRLYLVNNGSPADGDGETYLCDTLEPRRRNLKGGERKIAGATAIPEGRYPLVISKSAKFRRWLPTLLGVPDFSGILIHAGNTERDTRGCILVGTNSHDDCLINSQRALYVLMQLLTKAEGGMWISVE